jgi:hypothetical protein
MRPWWRWPGATFVPALPILLGVAIGSWWLVAFGFVASVVYVALALLDVRRRVRP